MPVPDWWNRTRYSLYAPVYDWVAKPLERGRERAIERLDLQPGDAALILGCGPGSDLDDLPEGVSVTAIDVAPAMIRRTEARAAELGLDVVPDADQVAAETERESFLGGLYTVTIARSEHAESENCPA